MKVPGLTVNCSQFSHNNWVRTPTENTTLCLLYLPSFSPLNDTLHHRKIGGAGAQICVRLLRPILLVIQAVIQGSQTPRASKILRLRPFTKGVIWGPRPGLGLILKGIRPNYRLK
jgi:hypothetical protein